MLLSPAACSRPTSISQAPPSPPRSAFPSSPDLPAELPGSILQENHGFPTCVVAEDLATVHPTSQNVRRSTGPLIRDVDYEDNFATLITLFPEPLIHSKSVPDLGQQFKEMRSVRSSAALGSSTVPKPSPLGTQHETPLSATSSRRSSKTEPVRSPTSADGKLAVYSTLTVGHNNSARAPPFTNQTLHPGSLNPEGHVRHSNAENREIRRGDVSTVCFSDVSCLFVKQNITHNETVSELLSFLFSSMIRRTVPEIDLLVENTQGHGFFSIGTIIIIWRRETWRMEQSLVFQRSAI
jgi:hypothetical protein